jgi:hypothetical protein
MINGNENSQKIPAAFMCSCGNEYKFLSGLSRHKNKCPNSTEKKEPILDEKKMQDDLLLVLIKENQEFKKMIVEQNNIVMEQNKKNNELILELAQKPTTTITNNNKNRFNINFFLNEKCKDAMNITDFVDSLKLTLQDLEKTGDVGYVKGLTNIIINGLNQLDVYKRPIHCSDVKRETLYIKDNDQWNKESEDKVVLTNALKHVVSKNMKLIPEWRDQHPKCNDSDSKENDRYLKIVMEAMPGSTKEESTNNYCKIIKNIHKYKKFSIINLK